MSLAFGRVLGAFGFPRPGICDLRGRHRLCGSAKDRIDANPGRVDRDLVAAGMGHRRQAKSFAIVDDGYWAVSTPRAVCQTGGVVARPANSLDLASRLVLFRHLPDGHHLFGVVLGESLG